MKTHRNRRASSRQRNRERMPKSQLKLAEDILLQPWFLPKRVACAIRSLVTVDFHNKLRYVFDDYGCLLCGAETEYHSNGMCQPCYTRTNNKILRSLRRRGRQGGHPRLDLELFRQEKIAKKLLSRFVGASQKLRKRPHHGIKQNNPVYEAFAYRPDTRQTRRSAPSSRF
jgi:hypothetical protein